MFMPGIERLDIIASSEGASCNFAIDDGETGIFRVSSYGEVVEYMGEDGRYFASVMVNEPGKMETQLIHREGTWNGPNGLEYEEKVVKPNRRRDVPHIIYEVGLGLKTRFPAQKPPAEDRSMFSPLANKVIDAYELVEPLLQAHMRQAEND